MLTMAAPSKDLPSSPKHQHCSDSDSDDSDVAFAYMDFTGVEFDDGVSSSGKVVEEDGMCTNNTKPKPNPSKDEDNALPKDKDDNDQVKREGATISKVNDDGLDGVVQPLSDTALTNNDVNTPDGANANSNANSSSSNDNHSLRKKALSSITFPTIQIELSDIEKKMLAVEKDMLLPRFEKASTAAVSALAVEDDECIHTVTSLFDLLENGKYAEILQSDVALTIFGSNSQEQSSYSTDKKFDPNNCSMMEQIKRRILNQFPDEIAVSNCNSNTNNKTNSSIIKKCIILEIIGIASLNLFLQLNYTGPSLDRGLKPEEEEKQHPLDGINPHGMFDTLAHMDKSESISGAAEVSTSLPLASISEDDKSITSTTHVHSLKETNTTNAFHNTVLSELAVDGEWPYQVCVAPYFLLLGRTILSMLAEPTRPFTVWNDVFSSSTFSSNDEGAVEKEGIAASLGISSSNGSNFASGANHLCTAKLWNARAIVAHRRLISTRHDDDDGQACPTLWNEAEAMFSQCITDFCNNQDSVFEGNDSIRNTHIASEVMLEWGLAQHHFRKPRRGKDSFNKALEIAKLEVEVTGAEGKRTKYQQKATAQYLVRAKPSSSQQQQHANDDTNSNQDENNNIEKQMIKHVDVDEDAILLEKIKFEDQDDNVHYNLSIHDQSILLALCLDVKNDNPMDGLTGEQMGAYLARVLNQHDDWMVYSTALLERAWLECERVHGRERAILQIQALADQHSNRLTLTQSTFKSVEEESAPAQDRLRNLHGIVYPPRWLMLRDLAERYAKLGIVTTAAEMFEELELWDEVVECYRLAGKEGRALEVVRARLAEKETPQMYAALGDLTNDPTCFERALVLSNGKYYDAHVALGKFYFDKGDLRNALKHYQEGLEIKPLMPAVWFRLGTIAMQLKNWDVALRAFTEVVQQEPEEGDAWANVAAIHMHRCNPAEAYPALIEVSIGSIFAFVCPLTMSFTNIPSQMKTNLQSLKQNRNNWRVWISKLYTCIDLKKYDEAIQTCTELLKLRARTNSSDQIPPPEEKCIRAIVGGSLKNYYDARASEDDIALDSSKRTIVRVRELLDKMKSSIKSEVWLYEVSAYVNEEMGWKEDVFNDHMKEYRTLQAIKGWEEDPVKISQMTSLVKEICSYHKSVGTKESLFKCKLLISGVTKKIRKGCCDVELPNEVAELETLLSEVENDIASHDDAK